MRQNVLKSIEKVVLKYERHIACTLDVCKKIESDDILSHSRVDLLSSFALI